jgi:hypothetical protein
VQVTRGEAVAVTMITGPFLEIVQPDAVPTLVTVNVDPSESLS